MELQTDPDDLLYDLASECEDLLDQKSKELSRIDSKSAILGLCDEFQQRFAMWAEHLGVFARRSQCLDTRLRNHPDLRELTYRLLDILRRYLHQWKCDGSIQLREDQGLKTTLKAVDDALSRLSQLGVTIRRSSSSKANRRVERFAAELELRPFASLCEWAVEALYPLAHPSLKDHLSKSMVDRYSRILYNKSRHQKLKTRREPRELPVELPTIQETATEEIQLNNPVVQPTRPHKPPVTVDNVKPPTILSQSDLSSVDPQRIGKQNRPPDEVSTKFHKTPSVQVNQCNYPRRPAASNVFTCEWCSEVLNKKSLSENEWHRHIHRDLKPYVCVSEECTQGHPSYPTFDEWFAHMKLHDRGWQKRVYLTDSWFCALCESDQDAYNDSQLLYSHLEKCHSDGFTRAQLQAFSRQSKTKQHRAWNDCLLCSFAIDGQSPGADTGSDKRRKGLAKKDGTKSLRKNLEMMNPEPHSSGIDSSDTSSDSEDHVSLRRKPQRTEERSKTVARHIASHLQVLMLLTIRFAGLQDDDGGLDDDINSKSAEINEESSSPGPDDSYESLSDSSLRKEAIVIDADELRNSEDIMDLDYIAVEDDSLVPDMDITLDDVPRQYDNLSAKTKAEFVNNVKTAFEGTPAERFFKNNPKFIEELAVKAAFLADDITTSICNKDLLPKIAQVTMHQNVIYCDDSSSMKREGRWDSQNQLINRIARITTRILPEGEGIYMRYINQEIPNSDSLKFEELLDIVKPLTWGGDTPIGTNLKSKILQPLVYSKLPNDLKRPLLVSVITDGMPEPEPKDTFVDAIAECGDKLEAAGLPRESVKFMIGQVGSATAATKFLQDVGKEPRIQDVVFVASEKLDVITSGLENDWKMDEWVRIWKMDEWLIEMLYAPIMKGEGKKKQ
ncbi:unnamed protein product [Clonostachys solani]|uniref:C2H2-type domain-containing protein n=1 Tax=Clonostachys solani TaxID=160281 RepID=A0A9N9ZNK0_9HYPO|nr:unnamed protein product [Clonostachys solani]